jgi:DNA-binding NarL/FixJ family response regulator
MGDRAATLVHLAVRDHMVKRRIGGLLALRQEMRVVEGLLGQRSEAEVRIVLLAEVNRSIPPAATSPRVIALGDGHDDAALVCAWLSGAWGYARTRAHVDELAGVIRRVAGGESPLLEAISHRPQAASLLLSRVMNGSNVQSLAKVESSPLTERQSQILSAVVRGEKGTVIAGRLNLGKQTVKNHIQEILAKTGTHTRAQAAAVAISKGWLAAPD